MTDDAELQSAPKVAGIGSFPRSDVELPGRERCVVVSTDQVVAPLSIGCQRLMFLE